MYSFLRNTQYLAPKWRAYVTPHSNGFRFANGVVVTSLWELKQALLMLDESVIVPHLSNGRNHIADWVAHTVGDAPLAQALRPLTQRWGLIVALERHMMRTLSLPSYVAKRWLPQSPSPFVFAGGEHISSLQELLGTLPTISDETLSFHYQRFPNDLSTWIADMIGDYYLADSLEEVNGKEQACLVVEDHLTMLRDALAE